MPTSIASYARANDAARYQFQPQNPPRLPNPPTRLSQTESSRAASAWLGVAAVIFRFRSYSWALLGNRVEEVYGCKRYQTIERGLMRERGIDFQFNRTDRNMSLSRGLSTLWFAGCKQTTKSRKVGPTQALPHVLQSSAPTTPPNARHFLRSAFNGPWTPASVASRLKISASPRWAHPYNIHPTIKSDSFVHEILPSLCCGVRVRTSPNFQILIVGRNGEARQTTSWETENEPSITP